MVFQIGSMTKQFTSVAILQLVELGKVSLDDPIQNYVKYFPQKKYPVTIHHLLSQT
jgi:CubicO group peptidase (beta-lactamase class C family)